MGALAGLDQLQRGTDGIGGGVGGAAQQGVGIAHLHQHGAEVVALQQVGAAVLGAHLALAELDHGLHHLLHVGIGGGVDDLQAFDVKTALGGLGLDDVHVADQDRSEEAALLQLGSSLQNPGVMAFGEDDLTGRFLELIDENIKHDGTSCGPKI